MSVKDNWNRQVSRQQDEYNQYSPQFGDAALYGIQHNPASSMFNPDWYYRAQDQSESGLNGAQAAQDKLDATGNAYDKSADNFDQFAQGAGAQMEPGLQKQQQATDKQQGQADWMWNNPGFTDQEKNDINVGSMTPIAGTYSAAAADVGNNAARTGNGAAYGAQAGDLARQKAQALSMQALNNQGLFAQQRIAGTQAANEAQGAAGQAQGASNASRQSATGLQSNIFDTGANIRQGAANIRLGQAGSNLQRSATAQDAQRVHQGAAALQLAPTQMAAGMYGQVQGARNNVLNNQTQMALQPSFGRTLTQGFAGSLGKVSAQGAKFGMGG